MFATLDSTSPEKSCSWLDGWVAHRQGVNHASNPYDVHACNYSYGEWSDGWCSRCDACKHDLPQLREIDDVVPTN